MRVTLLVRICALLAVFGVLATMANPVSAGKPEKVLINDEFDEVICDIPVHTTVTGFLIFHIQDYVIQAEDPETQDDFWIGVIQFHLDITSTNAEGVTITNSVRQINQEGDLVDNGDGTWTFTYAVNGAPLKLRSGNDTVLFDRGRITFEEVIYFGDLSTIEDNEFISGQITSISGPHPEAESDFTLFCEVFTDVMG
jgi:hypothetical protein